MNALKPLVFPLALTAALTLPALEWLRAVDLYELVYGVNDFPPGQEFYLAAKLLGMIAMSVAVVQIGLSALSRARLVRTARSDHAVLGGLITLAVVAHVASFVTGVSIRNGHITWHLLAPDLMNGSYNRGVGMGVIGLWLMLLGVAVPILRGKAPRLLHRAALIGCALGLVHAVWIGTEKQYIWLLVSAFLAVFAVAGLSRILIKRRRALTR